MLDILPPRILLAKLKKMERQLPIFLRNVIAKANPDVIVLIERGGVTTFLSVIDSIHLPSQGLKITSIRLNKEQNTVQINPDMVVNRRVLILDDMMFSGRTMQMAIDALKKFTSCIGAACYCISAKIKERSRSGHFEGVPLDYCQVSLDKNQQMEFENVLAHFMDGQFFPPDVTCTYVSGNINPPMTLGQIKQFALQSDTYLQRIPGKGIRKLCLLKDQGDLVVWIKIYLRKLSDFRAFGYLSEGSMDICAHCGFQKMCRRNLAIDPEGTLCDTKNDSRIKGLLVDSIRELAGGHKVCYSADPLLDTIYGCVKDRTLIKT